MIGPADPRWRATLPHRVAPLGDEWLAGLLLRCDRANGWAAGTAGRGLLHVPAPPEAPERTVAAFATARRLDLARLAELLAVPLPAVRRTTFEEGLTRLRAPGQATARRLMVGRPFRVCPACVADRRLIARGHARPRVGACLEHGLLLASACPCGAHLRPFHRAGPFTCPDCRAAWADLPSRRADDEALARSHRLLTLSRFFLEHGDATSIANAMRAICAETARRGLRQLAELPGGAALPSVLWEGASVSLTRVVEALAALGLPPEAVRPPDGVRVPPDEVPCWNPACPHFGRAGEGNVHPFRRRAGSETFFCAECGAHFRRDRLSSAFDPVGHRRGEAPAPHKLAKQQARLATWRQAIEPACAQMLAEGVPISVAAAFRRAGIPRTPRLRAPRLGLVGVVERYIAYQAADLRGRILAGWREGMTRQELAQGAGVSWSLLRRVVARRPRVRKAPAGRPRRIPVEQHDALRAQLEANRAATLTCQAKLWGEAHGTTIDLNTMRDAIHRLGWSRIEGRWTPPSDAARPSGRKARSRLTTSSNTP
jgi:transposase